MSALLLTAVAASAPASPPDDRAEEGFVNIFNGKDLQGWSHQARTPAPHVGCTFFVKDGLLVGDQGPNHSGGFLMTDDEYEDFILRFQIQMDYPTDSGVFIRMNEEGRSQQITLDNRPKGQFGSIYVPWAQGRVHACPEGIKAFKQGEWNDVEVRVENQPPRIRFSLNGTLVTDFQHTEKTCENAPTKGRIAFQVHPNVPNLIIWEDGNTVRFRNIRVKRRERNTTEAPATEAARP
jgi:hypothetical protein